ncbi:TPA: hypothetical protein HA278_05635 [Candidatus Woesearchaeota archaeon]|nr:hypothetical protein [archaeon]HIJ11511.1 hypothetical protein [Candidatus Woesearchaeota archaeon]
MSLLLVLIPALLVGTFAFFTLQAELIDQISEERQIIVEQQANQIRELLHSQENQVLLMRDLPPISGIIRAAQHNGIDPVDGSTLNEWKKRLEDVFQRMMGLDGDIDRERNVPKVQGTT